MALGKAIGSYARVVLRVLWRVDDSTEAGAVGLRSILLGTPTGKRCRFLSPFGPIGSEHIGWPPDLHPQVVQRSSVSPE